MIVSSSVRAANWKTDEVTNQRRASSSLFRGSVMEVCGSSKVTLREFGCEQSLLSRPDGSASFIQGKSPASVIRRQPGLVQTRQNSQCSGGSLSDPISLPSWSECYCFLLCIHVPSE